MWGVKMGIIFEVITENKSSIIEVLIEILKQAEKRGIQIYEDECLSYEGKYGQSRDTIARTSDK